MYIVTQHRWTYFLFIVLIIVNVIIVVLGRSYRIIVNHQKTLLYSQSVLLGLILMGMAGYHKDTSWRWSEFCYIFICTLPGFIINSTILITLIKLDRIELYHNLKEILIYGCFVVNILVALCVKDIESFVYFTEMFIFYAFYYYHQLNMSLLKEPDTLPEQQNLFETIKNYFKPPDHDQQFFAAQAPQINSDYIVLNKKFILASVVVAGFGVLIYLSIVSHNQIFKILLFIGSALIVSLFFNTQVASRTLQDQDHYYAASLQFIDMLCPIKNLIRSCGY